MRLATVPGLLLTGARRAGGRRQVLGSGLGLGLRLGHGKHRQQSTGSTSSSRPGDRPVVLKKHARSHLTLAIETSCDDTCVAILEKHGDRAIIHFNAKVTANNLRFGGVEPISAVESHSAYLAPLIKRALRSMPTSISREGNVEYDTVAEETRCYRARLSFISVTRGPGMTSALSVGLAMAKGMSVALGVPMVAVHHMQAHALTPRLVDALARPPVEVDQEGTIIEELPSQEPQFPFLSLLVSGGHTQLLLSESITSHTVMAEAQNVAIGDMLDKCARAILPASVIAGAENVMYAAQLEAFAFPAPEREWLNEPADPYETKYGYVYNPPATRADEIKPYVSPTYGWGLTPPLAERRDMVYDFSGLGGQVRAIMEKKPDMDVDERRELARETMRVAFEHLASRLVLALDAMRKRRWLAAKKRKGTGGDDAAAAGELQDNASANNAAAAAAEEKQDSTNVNDQAAAEEKQDNDNANANDDADPDPNGVRIPSSMNYTRAKTLVVAGGVASNNFLLFILRRVLEARGYVDDRALEIVRPPADMCTDNAAMVAWAGMEMYEAGWHSRWNVLPVRKWSMDNYGGGAAAGGAVPDAKKEGERGGEAQQGNKQQGGILELGGWLRRTAASMKKDASRVLTKKQIKTKAEIWKKASRKERRDPNYTGWMDKMGDRTGKGRRLTRDRRIAYLGDPSLKTVGMWRPTSKNLANSKW